jgi:Cu2+-exporting ATPase
MAGVLVAIERRSEHPLAAAVVAYLEGFAGADRQLSLTAFETLPGMGVRAKVDGEEYFVGNESLLREFGIKRSGEVRGKTVVYFANRSRVLAVLGLADKLKEGSREAVDRLRKEGIEIHLVTGDGQGAAVAVARELGITDVAGGVLPAEKTDYVRRLQEKGRIVAMVGDGINDSAALAQADVGIAMGKGADIAMDVAQLTILSSDLRRVPEAIRLSKRTVATIRQNLFWAFVYNLIGIPVAAGVLFPLYHFLLSPMIAGAAMALSSVSVVSNSLRLKLKKL